MTDSKEFLSKMSEINIISVTFVAWQHAKILTLRRQNLMLQGHEDTIKYQHTAIWKTLYLTYITQYVILYWV